eukprot:EG_transcript_10429
MPLLAGGASGYVDGPAEQASFRFPCFVVADEEGSLFIGDAGNARVRKLSASGTVSTVAGSGEPGWQDGPGPEAQFKFPSSVGLDPRPSGWLLVGDCIGHCIRAIDPEGVVSTIAGTPGESGYRDGPARQAQFMEPAAVHAGPSGDLFVVDRDNHCIRRIDTEARIVSTFAGTGHPGLRDGAGSQAQFRLPVSCAVTADGTLWVTEIGNHDIRRVDLDGTVATVAGNGNSGYADGQGAEAQFACPSGIVLDGNGNLLVADTLNDCIRLVTPAGYVSTLLGLVAGPQGLCPCRKPVGLALTQSSELVITDFHRHRLFVVPAGVPPHRRSDARHSQIQRLFALAPQQRHIADLLQKAPGGATPAAVLQTNINSSLPEVQAFLLYVYTSEIQAPEHIIGLMDLCQRHGRPDGVQRCLQYCRRHVCPTNAIPWLVEGHRRGLAELTLWLQRYIHQHWDTIRLVSPQSFNLMQPYPELLEATVPAHMRLKRREQRTLPAPTH